MDLLTRFTYHSKIHSQAAIKRAKDAAQPEIDRLIETEKIKREEAEKRVPLDIECEVTATFRRASAASRTRYLDSLATYRAKIRELYRQRRPLEDERQAAIKRAKAAAKPEVDRLIEAEQITREDAEKRVPLDIDFPEDRLFEWTAQTSEIRRLEKESTGYSMLRALLVSIEGISYDGAPVTAADQLIEDASAELTDELVDVAEQISALSPAERGESPWPGTLVQPVVGPPISTTAPLVESEKEPG